ncbi:carnitine O-acetyltransferase-like [Hydractinia symbiolongicarpus]|uniref:carnitine O-acetyltransferase-like n=1 Tax=Hydractinia symbiolongicarpus TaxID=13093 RepID=UPI00254CA33C|nr:carnitine O-acetyltransferase-like [Hydractinia symbiolongicarpus]
MLKWSRLGLAYAKTSNRIVSRKNFFTPATMATKTSNRPKTMLSCEDKLPHLPVPPLRETMEKYVTSLEPLLFDHEYENTKNVVAEFQRKDGIGESLQKKLMEKAANSDNWLSEWWDNCAYFAFRAPVVINSSPGITFPAQTFYSDQDQYRYTARLIRSVLEFKSLIDSQSLPVDYAGKDPLTMKQYQKLLSACRVPYAKCDGEILTSPEESRHVMVAHNNHFFKLDVFHEGTDKPLSEEELVQQLDHIVNLSRYEDDYPVGVLTSHDRNVWAQAYKRLTRDPENRGNVDTIIKSICLICLDQPVNVPSGTEHKYESPHGSVGCEQMLHGGGSQQNSMNRWFDKICQFVVNRNGMVGLCYEHSGAEGPPVMALCEAILKKKFEHGTSVSLPANSQLPSPHKLIWSLNYDLVDRVELAKEHIDQMVNDVTVKLFDFDDFGKNIPKRFKVSPDAFFQVSLQLAYYRLHCHHPPTYESASIRKFVNGRTETIRSATPAAARYAREMDRNNYDSSVKRKLFMKAVEAHVKYTIEAMNFQAVDRHLLGLKLIALENGIPLPELFRDKAYGYALHFRLSTSQVPAKAAAALCFGPVVPDGYGVCYNPMENRFLYAVSSYNSHPKTHSGDFGEYIAKALQDNQLLLSTQSKL